LQILKDNGGAIKVTAGGAFCAALTQSGRVVVWGQPRGGGSSSSGKAGQAASDPFHQQQQHQAQQQEGAASGAAPVEREEEGSVPNLRILRQAGVLVAEVVDLPPMTDVAAGFSHISFTDGGSVWTIGRQAPPPSAVAAAAAGGSAAAAAAAAAAAPDLGWLQPRRVLHRPDEGVASLAAGSFAAAAITGAGELFLWGSLLSEDASAALLKKSGEWPSA
jgi:hypothetical protein